MSRGDVLVPEGQVIDAREESGTAPSDRRFRPDVEGLRAVAVLLVVLYHAHVPGVGGGYVGVDVFFVISGFVITGVLLREHHTRGRTSILNFYARRIRRILPAATVTILGVVAATYVMLGSASGNNAATDGQWAAIFLANFHFEAVGTNYFTAAFPPSPIQNFWSLSVEEQFYFVYPTLFLVVASARRLFTLKVRLTIMLVVVIGASYWLSVTLTAANPQAAYFSPLTRAWELALGALLSVGSDWLRQMPHRIASFMTWAGMAAIVGAACGFSADTAYPGALVAVPVLGAGLVIAGGTAAPRRGVEALLGLQPFEWLGRRSYALYLWHWPILIIAAEVGGVHTPPLSENLVLVAVALVISMASYSAVESPIRRKVLSSKLILALGIGAVATTVVLLSIAIRLETSVAGTFPVTPAPDEQAVLRNVASAPTLTSVPRNVQPPVTKAGADLGKSYARFNCVPGYGGSTVPICALGDPRGAHLMVVYGDSHAFMWLPALDYAATQNHWRLVMLGKPACPADPVTVTNPPNWESPAHAFTACSKWHQWAVTWINQHKPNMVVITQRSLYNAPSTGPGSTQVITVDEWRRGMQALLDSITLPGVEKVVIGSTPASANFDPQCLAAHERDVETCSAPTEVATAGAFNDAERAATQRVGARYVDPIPWFCSHTCTALIGNYVVFSDSQHITATYSRYLQVVLTRALGFP